MGGWAGSRGTGRNLCRPQSRAGKRFRPVVNLVLSCWFEHRIRRNSLSQIGILAEIWRRIQRNNEEKCMKKRTNKDVRAWENTSKKQIKNKTHDKKQPKKQLKCIKQDHHIKKKQRHEKETNQMKNMKVIRCGACGNLLGFFAPPTFFHAFFRCHYHCQTAVNQQFTFTVSEREVAKWFYHGSNFGLINGRFKETQDTVDKSLNQFFFERPMSWPHCLNWCWRQKPYQMLGTLRPQNWQLKEKDDTWKYHGMIA